MRPITGGPKRAQTQCFKLFRNGEAQDRRTLISLANNRCDSPCSVACGCLETEVAALICRSLLEAEQAHGSARIEVSPYLSSLRHTFHSNSPVDDACWWLLPVLVARGYKAVVSLFSTLHQHSLRVASSSDSLSKTQIAYRHASAHMAHHRLFIWYW